MLDKVLWEIGDCAAGSEEMDDPLDEPHDQNAQPVDGALEQDGLDHWRATEAAHKGQLVGYQDCFSN
jgi:hypothetical protein